jgi:hypothetical protein
LRHIVRELTRELPAAAPARPELREMAGYGYGTVMHLMRLVAPRLPDEDHTKDMDFNSPRIHARWQAGLSDCRRALARQAWLAPAGSMDGLVQDRQRLRVFDADAAAETRAPATVTLAGVVKALRPWRRGPDDGVAALLRDGSVWWAAVAA